MPLATALCKNLPAENAQRQLSRPKPTRVAVPIEEEEEKKKKKKTYVRFTPPPPLSIYAYDDDDTYSFVSPPLHSFIPWLHVSATTTTVGNVLYKQGTAIPVVNVSYC